MMKSVPARYGATIRHRHVAVLFYLYGFAFGIGTNLILEWYYPIRGIGVLDILLVIHFALLVLTNDKTYALRMLPIKAATVSCLILALLFWLLFSVWINSFTYGADILNLFAILRL